MKEKSLIIYLYDHFDESDDVINGVRYDYNEQRKYSSYRRSSE